MLAEVARFLRWIGGLSRDEFGRRKLEISEACETYASALEDEEELQGDEEDPELP